MRKEDSSTSVEEMIRRYNQELLDFRRQHNAVRQPETVATAAPVRQAENRFDEAFPVPDIEQDLQNLRNAAQQGNQTAMPQMPTVPQTEPGPVVPMTPTAPGGQMMPPVQMEPGPAIPPMETAPGSAMPMTPTAPGGQMMPPLQTEPGPAMPMTPTPGQMMPQQQEPGQEVPLQPPRRPAESPQGTPFYPTNPAPEEVLPSAQPMDMSLGYLRVFVNTARGALPVRDALVTVTRIENGGETLEKTGVTDISGNTPLFTLPAVSGIYSLSPDSKEPYTYYTIYIRADGFYPVQLRNVPLYGGITSVQPVTLIPVAEGGTQELNERIIEGAPANL